MEYTLNVKIQGGDGRPLPYDRLKTLYVSDLHFEPVRRAIEVKSDGTADIKIPGGKTALHVFMEIPGFGDMWVTADNCGMGYGSSDRKTLEFTKEAARSRLKDVEDILKESGLSSEGEAHREAALELLNISAGSDRAAHLYLKALYHALWAGEYAVVEKARQVIAGRPERKGFLFGCNTFALKDDDYINGCFKAAFNFGTLPFYLRALEPEEGKPDYSRTDALLDWCGRNGITVKGHPLWWGHEAGVPDWLKGATWQEARKHCQRVVTRSVERYRNQIQIWDSINEAHDWANGLSLTHEQEIEITRVACESVYSINPDATVIVNNCMPFGENVADHMVHLGPVYDKVFTPLSYLDALMEADVKFDVIGVQIYFPARDMLSINKLLNEYARFGKPVHITELGVRSGEQTALRGDVKEPAQVMFTHGAWHQKWCEKVQADWMEWFYTVAYARDEIKAITWWDLKDPAFIKTGGFLQEDGTPKEIFFRLKALRKAFEK